jgi:hypothetical protein
VLHADAAAPEPQDPLEEAEEPEVLIYDYLREHGFSEEVAQKITLTAILHNVTLPVSYLREVANACGYALPDTPFVES